MFKFPVVLAVGLSAALSAAHADTYIIQGTPTFEPAIVTDGEVMDLPDLSHSILQNPAFHRLAQVCETMGVACGADQVTAEGGIAPEWTPRHIADAEKRLAQMLEEREEIAQAMIHPVPLPPVVGATRYPPLPQLIVPWDDSAFVPRPRHIGSIAPQDLPPVPFTPLWTQVTPPNFHGAHDLSGFYQRLNTPRAVMPHSLFPRHTFPWRSF